MKNIDHYCSVKVFFRGAPLWLNNEIVQPVFKCIKDNATGIVIAIMGIVVFAIQTLLFAKMVEAPSPDEFAKVAEFAKAAIVVAFAFWITVGEFIALYKLYKLFKRICDYGNNKNN